MYKFYMYIKMSTSNLFIENDWLLNVEQNKLAYYFNSIKKASKYGIQGSVKV